MNDYRTDNIDTYIRKCAKQAGRLYEETKLGYQFAYDLGILDIRAFAEHAGVGVTEDAVRRYFGDDDTDEPEEADEPDDSDETEATTQDATQILSQQIDLLEADSNNILDSADRNYNAHAGYDTSRLIDQVNSLNHQLNILTRMLAIHTRNTLKEGEGR